MSSVERRRRLAKIERHVDMLTTQLVALQHWQSRQPTQPEHRQTRSTSHSLVFDEEMIKMQNIFTATNQSDNCVDSTKDDSRTWDSDLFHVEIANTYDELLDGVPNRVVQNKDNSQSWNSNMFYEEVTKLGENLIDWDTPPLFDEESHTTIEDYTNGDANETEVLKPDSLSGVVRLDVLENDNQKIYAFNVFEEISMRGWAAWKVMMIVYEENAEMDPKMAILADQDASIRTIINTNSLANNSSSCAISEVSSITTVQNLLMVIDPYLEIELLSFVNNNLLMVIDPYSEIELLTFVNNENELWDLGYALNPFCCWSLCNKTHVLL